MKTTKLLVLLGVLISCNLLQAQTPVQVETLPAKDNQLGYDRDSLKAWISDVFHGGGGIIDTASITFTGNRRAFGRFYNGSDIGFQKGLIISNGAVESAEYPNNVGGKEEQFFPFDPEISHGDEDLYGMYKSILQNVPGATKDTGIQYTGDAAVIEFYYQPFNDMISLDYVFASEEYPCPSFPATKDVDLTGFPTSSNQIFDLFAISIEKYGFSNLAYMMPLENPPSSELSRWVNVMNVNESKYSSYYQQNPTDPPLGVPLGTQFDAITKTTGDHGPLKIERKSVEACKQYKVKIAIEDFYWTSPSPDILESGFRINSAVFLGANSLKSIDQGSMTMIHNYKIDYEYYNTSFSGDIIEGDCNYIIATVTLDDTMAFDYNIPFLIHALDYRDRVEIAYKDSLVITNDTITMVHGKKVQQFTIKAINLDADIANVKFKYPINPCDGVPGPFGTPEYKGEILFNLRNNDPISFTQNPKVFEAFCKETIDLNITDVTENGVDPLSYFWDNDFAAHETVSYQVEDNPDYVPVRVKDGCGNDTTIQVKINNKPVVLDNIFPAFLCGPGQFKDVVINPSGVSADFEFVSVEWFNNVTLAPLGQDNSGVVHVVYDNAIGANNWVCGFKITDCCGGVTQGSFDVNQTEMSLGDDIWICNGESIELMANADGTNFIWYETGNPGVSLSNTLSVIVAPTLTTSYVFSMTDNCAEFQDDTITVNVDQFIPTISIDPVTEEICLGESVTLTANTAENWSWIPSNETTQSISVTPTSANTYSYTLTASSLYCIDKEVTADFEVFPNPVANFTMDPGNDACTGEPIVFLYPGTPTNEFLWNFDDGSPTSALANPEHVYPQSGTYNIYLHVDKYICENDTTIPLIVNPLPIPDFEADVTDACGNADVDFSDKSTEVFPSATYQWTFGDGDSDDIAGNTTHNYDTPGLYSVGLTIYNTARCSQTTEKIDYISVNPNPDAEFEADPWITTMDTPTIEFNDLSFSDGTITNWEWDFGDGNTSSDESPEHTYATAQDYEILLKVETTDGCWDTIRHPVALTEDIRLFFPNAFTPNGDGVNDSFVIKGTPITDFNMYIYDRWGEVIWSSHSFETHWDGNDKNGDPVNSGTYVYVISGTDYRKNVVSHQGTVTVIR